MRTLYTALVLALAWSPAYAAEGDIASVVNDFNQLQEAFVSSKKLYCDLQQEHLAKTREYDEKLLRLRRENASLETSLETVTLKKDSLQQQLAQRDAAGQENDKRVAALEKENMRLFSQLKEQEFSSTQARAEISSLESRLSAARQKADTLQAQLECAQKRSAQLQKEKAEAQCKLDDASALSLQVQRMKEQARAQQREWEDKAREYQGAIEALEKENASLKSLAAQQKELSSWKKDAEARLSQAAQEKSSLEDQVAVYKSQLAQQAGRYAQGSQDLAERSAQLVRVSGEKKDLAQACEKRVMEEQRKTLAMRKERDALAEEMRAMAAREDAVKAQVYDTRISNSEALIRQKESDLALLAQKVEGLMQRFSQQEERLEALKQENMNLLAQVEIYKVREGAREQP